MKYLFTYLVLGFYSCFLQAQTATYLSSFGSSGSDYATGITVLVDGYLVIGYTDGFGAKGNDIYMTKTDFNGSVVWSKKVGGENDDIAYSITPTSDSNFVLSGYSNSDTTNLMGAYNVILIKIDALGNMLWSKKYGGILDESGLCIKEAKNKDLLIAGYTSSIGSGGQDAMVMRVDSGGVLKWFKSYGTTATENANSIIELDNGDLVIGGSEKLNTTTQHIIGLKLDSLGNIKWQKLYNVDNSNFNNPYARWVNDVIYLNDKNIMFAGTLGKGFVGNGDPFLLKTDTAGNTLYAKEYAFNSGLCGANKVIQTSSGFCVYGYMQSAPILFGTNSSAITTWDYGYSIPTTYYINASIGDLKALPNNAGFVIASYVNNSGNDDISFIKTSSVGFVPCGSNLPTYSAGSTSSASVSVSSLSFSSFSGGLSSNINIKDTIVSSSYSAQCTTASVDQNIMPSTVRLFPSPCDNWLNISLEANTDNAKFKLYDVFGNFIMQSILSENQTKIYLKDISSGLYIYVLDIGGNNTKTGKLQIIH